MIYFNVMKLNKKDIDDARTVCVKCSFKFKKRICWGIGCKIDST